MAFEFKLPDIGEGVVEGEIVRWLIREGEEVREDQPMVEVMTDKATVEIPSPVSGRVSKLIGNEGETVAVGSTLLVIETDESPGKAPDAPKSPSPRRDRKESPPSRKRGDSAGLATPAVRRLARERGIDLSKIRGTGAGGRITAEDLRDHEKSPSHTRPARPEAGETLPYRGIRKKVGEHLAAAKRTAAHYTYVEEAEVGELVRLRSRILEDLPRQQIRLTYLPFIIQAVVEGLKTYPLLNSKLDEEEGVIRLHRRFDIGVAVATEEGLVVPVIRNADRKDLLELSKEVAELSEAARNGALRLEDLREGSFTITSLGAFGGVFATPILNWPEVGILGVHKISRKPIVRNDRIVIGEVMNLSLTLDHRVVDGAVGARFLHHVIRYLETPGLLLLKQ